MSLLACSPDHHDRRSAIAIGLKTPRSGCYHFHDGHDENQPDTESADCRGFPSGLGSEARVRFAPRLDLSQLRMRYIHISSTAASTTGPGEGPHGGHLYVAEHQHAQG